MVRMCFFMVVISFSVRAFPALDHTCVVYVAEGKKEQKTVGNQRQKGPPTRSEGRCSRVTAAAINPLVSLVVVIVLVDHLFFVVLVFLGTHLIVAYVVHKGKLY